MDIARRITCRGVVILDGKILAVRQKTADWGSNDWCLPGGKLEPGESITDCASREMFEETGIVPKIGDLLFVQQFSDGSVESPEFFFQIINADDYLSIDLSKSSHGELEIEQIEFVDPKTTNILPRFFSEIELSELSGTKFFSYL